MLSAALPIPLATTGLAHAPWRPLAAGASVMSGRAGLLSLCELPDDDLAAAFAAEARRRQSRVERGRPGQPPPVPPSPEGAGVVREVVLRDGKAVSIPRRPPPPNFDEQGGNRLSIAGLVFGGALTLVTLGLLLAIATADAGV
eukprot:scaffold2123_cov32-Tisochrysis_lutea.AAC.1